MDLSAIKDAYKVCDREVKDGELITFVDGPPFVSGSLHYGHIVIGALKDFIRRYYHMMGYKFPLKLCYDTHGFPVESAVMKLLSKEGKNHKTLSDKEFNEHCMKFVNDNIDSWGPIYDNIGRWCDLNNRCLTMDNNSIETFWWVFNEIYKRGLVYSAYKVMPYSVGANTPISKTEASEDFRDISDPSLYVRFKLSDADEYLIAWTTTPWTLPANLALCVHKDIMYVRVTDRDTNNVYILSKNCLVNLYSKKKKLDTSRYTIIDEFPGSSLIGKKYEPLLNYYTDDKYFTVLHGDHVIDNDPTKNAPGTGIVHTAPGFGQDDHEVCLGNNVVTRTQIDICPIDDDGCYTEIIHDHKGKFVFTDGNRDVITQLKSMNCVVLHNNITHRYAHCPRTGGKLINRLCEGLFINVSSIRRQLIELSEQITWVPAKTAQRYNNWVSNSADWCVTRNRKFGTPVPMYVSDDGDVRIISCKSELEKYTGVTLDDLHIHSIDKLDVVIDGKKYKRVPYVFDCWFESASIPLAQIHYPFENDDAFIDRDCLSDIVIEGIDQTNNWFYYSQIISAILFNRVAFKHINCVGFVLAEDGAKMAKRKQNFTPPQLLLDKYGADAMRLYICNSGVVNGDNLRFSDERLEAVRNKFSPWFNACVFYQEHSKGENISMTIDDLDLNVMDRWILRKTSDVILKIREEMKDVRVQNVFPLLLPYIDKLTNVYLKLNRDRLRGRGSKEDRYVSLSVLRHVLVQSAKAFAPICPFITEYIYRMITGNSVHDQPYPIPDVVDITEKEEYDMDNIIGIIEVIRTMRGELSTHHSVKIPIKHITIANTVDSFPTSMMHYVYDEGNIISHDMKILPPTKKCAVLNYKIAGKKFRRLMKDVEAYVESFTDDEIHKLTNGGSISALSGEVTIDPDDVIINDIVSIDVPDASYYRTYNDLHIIITPGSLDDPDVMSKHVVLMFNYHVQQKRKDCGLKVHDHVIIYYDMDRDLCDTLLNNKVLSKKLGCYPIYSPDKTNIDSRKTTAMDVITVNDKKIRYRMINAYDTDLNNTLDMLLMHVLRAFRDNDIEDIYNYQVHSDIPDIRDELMSTYGDDYIRSKYGIYIHRKLYFNQYMHKETVMVKYEDRNIPVTFGIEKYIQSQ